MLDYEEQIIAMLDKLLDARKNGSEERRKNGPARLGIARPHPSAVVAALLI
jgi:hypothetical protein